MNLSPRRRWTLPLVAIVLLAGACGAPAERPQGDRLTPESELPAEFGEAWRAWYDDSPEWPAWRARAAEDPRLARFLVDNLVRVMVRFYDRSALSRARDMPGYFERARRELVWMADDSGPVMVELVQVGDGVVAFLAGDLLVRMDDPRWSLEVARKLDVDEAEGRRRAAELLEKLPHARKAEAEVLERLERAALEDPEWFVRAQAVRAVGARARLGSDLTRSRRILSRALVDEDSTVALAACEGLAGTEDLQAVPVLLNLLESMERGERGNVALLRAAEAALARITGQKDLQGAAQWRAWWRENRP